MPKSPLFALFTLVLLALGFSLPSPVFASAAFLYDSSGQRLARLEGSGTRTYYIGSLEVQVAPDGGISWRRDYGGTVREKTASGQETVYFAVSDHLGSVSRVYDAGGNLTAVRTYYPYGQTRSASGTLPTDRAYTGQVSDQTQTGLYYYNARYYDPLTARFTQADRADDGLNKYAYVGGNPANRTDPTGNMFIADDGGGSGLGSSQYTRTITTAGGRKSTGPVKGSSLARSGRGSAPRQSSRPGPAPEPSLWSKTLNYLSDSWQFNTEFMVFYYNGIDTPRLGSPPINYGLTQLYIEGSLIAYASGHPEVAEIIDSSVCGAMGGGGECILNPGPGTALTPMGISPASVADTASDLTDDALALAKHQRRSAIALSIRQYLGLDCLKSYFPDGTLNEAQTKINIANEFAKYGYQIIEFSPTVRSDEIITGAPAGSVSALTNFSTRQVHLPGSLRLSSVVTLEHELVHIKLASNPLLSLLDHEFSAVMATLYPYSSSTLPSSSLIQDLTLEVWQSAKTYVYP